MMRRLLQLGLAWLLLAGGAAWAHKGSDAYLDVRHGASAGTDASAAAGQLRFVLSVALRDLDQLVAIDANNDARITWGEVKAALPQLLALFGEHANTGPFMAQGSQVADPCRLQWRSDGLERRGDGTYLRAVATANCDAGKSLLLHYSLFREQDATHRLLVGGQLGQRDLLSTTSPQQAEPLLLRAAQAVASSGASNNAAASGAASGRWHTLSNYFLLGMHHLLEGYDHLAFLLALVLPLQLVLGRRHASMPVVSTAVARAMPAQGAATWLALLRTVTAFTIGHSITLVLATLGWTQASPAWVEPVIALSIGVTAWLNIRPLAGLRTEWLALGFGMVHGYGFAGLLQEASAPAGLLPWALAGFNLGVEAGQLMAVAGWVLLVQVVVRASWYQRVVVRGGSLLLIGLASLWFWQRVA